MYLDDGELYTLLATGELDTKYQLELWRCGAPKFLQSFELPLSWLEEPLGLSKAAGGWGDVSF